MKGFLEGFERGLGACSHMSDIREPKMILSIDDGSHQICSIGLHFHDNHDTSQDPLFAFPPSRKLKEVPCARHVAISL